MFKSAYSLGLEGVASKSAMRAIILAAPTIGQGHLHQRETLPMRDFAIKENSSTASISPARRQGMVYAGKGRHGFDTASAKDLQARPSR